MRERKISSLAPCAAEALWEPNTSAVSALRFVPEGHQLCPRVPLATAVLTCLPSAVQDSCVFAENYPEEEQRELSHLCV